MDIKIHSVSFVTFSEITEGLDDDVITEIANSIGQDVTWGDSSHTLVRAQDAISSVDIDETCDPDLVEFKKRLSELPRFVLIDMEN
jgi:5-enolpyruvylshikimate-3-phosphate synthase